MSLIETLAARARTRQKKIVLPEGSDQRVLEAASQAAKSGICQPILLGNSAALTQNAKKLGLDLAGVTLMDPQTSSLLPTLAQAFFEKRQHKGVTLESALETLKEHPLYFGAMLVATQEAHGMVAGAVHSTGDVLRSAFQCVGMAPGLKLASSSFVMSLKAPLPNGTCNLLFADCAVNPTPDSADLVDIAHATTLTCQGLFDMSPRIAFLSFSTKGSAQHALTEKVRQATTLTQQRFAELGIEAVVDGEMQLDAALDAAVARAKNPHGKIQGDANILIFPDLQAGNIGYKLVERLAGATALGPIIQGLAQPVNDLSRGCSVNDIVGTICLTILQGKA